MLKQRELNGNWSVAKSVLNWPLVDLRLQHFAVQVAGLLRPFAFVPLASRWPPKREQHKIYFCSLNVSSNSIFICKLHCCCSCCGQMWLVLRGVVGPVTRLFASGRCASLTFHCAAMLRLLLLLLLLLLLCRPFSIVCEVIFFIPIGIEMCTWFVKRV